QRRGRRGGGRAKKLAGPSWLRGCRAAFAGALALSHGLLRERTERRPGCCLRPAQHLLGVLEDVRWAFHVPAPLDLARLAAIGEGSRAHRREFRPGAIVDAQIERVPRDQPEHRALAKEPITAEHA